MMLAVMFFSMLLPDFISSALFVIYPPIIGVIAYTLITQEVKSEPVEEEVVVPTHSIKTVTTLCCQPDDLIDALFDNEERKAWDPRLVSMQGKK